MEDEPHCRALGFRYQQSYFGCKPLERQVDHARHPHPEDCAVTGAPRDRKSAKCHAHPFRPESYFLDQAEIVKGILGFLEVL